MIHLAHAQQRIGNGFHEHAAGLLLRDGFLDRGEIANIDQTHGHAHGIENIHQQAHGGPIQRISGNHGFPAVCQRGEQRDVNCAHARTACESAVAAFERCAELFERRISRIVVPRIVKAGFLASEHAVQRFHIFVKETGRSVNRRGDGDMAPRFLAVAGVYGFGVDFHFLFHRVPSLVSSRMIPCSASWSRIRSDSAKLRAFLACTRFETSASTSASGMETLFADGRNTSKIESNRSSKSRAAFTLSDRNSPESMAILASRIYSNTAARASAVFKSSSRAELN